MRKSRYTLPRWRSGLMDFSLIGAPVLRLECLNPSILKTEHPLRHPCSINVVTSLKARRQPRTAFSRASGFVLWPKA